MLHIPAIEFLETWQHFEYARQLASANRGKMADQSQTNFLVKMLCKFNGHCNYMGLKVSAEMSSKLISWLNDPGNHRIWNASGGYTMPKEAPLPDFESVYKYLQDIGEKVHQEIAPIRLPVAPLGKTRFLDRDKLFGEKVFVVFEGAREDIQNAGNCLALGINNAVVFYLMCVVECALRRLADNLGVVLVKSIPIEQGTWNEVITELQKEINKRIPRSDSAGQTRLNLCSEILIEFRAIEQFWRNKVAHTRASYNELDAENAFNHVERFMKKLADLIGN